MAEFKAAYPYGEPLGGIVVPGSTRALVVGGAALAIVDLTAFETNGEPKALGYVEIPDITTLAMKYRLGAQGQRAVYFAGGSLGLWKVDLCNALFTSSAPPPCSPPSEIVDRVGCEANFTWKRCVEMRPSSTGLEIDANNLYCATVRDGVHLLEIGPAIPTGPGPLPTFARLDTPGMATGIAFRRPDLLNRHADQMLVGDSRAGLRLYCRIGQ